MLEFVRSAPLRLPLRRWTAIDAVMLFERLRKAGYEDFFEANLENPSFELPSDYDVAVLLHILEHLFEPEAAVQKVVRRIRPGGALIGGFPVVPALFADLRERKVREKAAPMGHVSVFSPARVRRMATAMAQLKFVSGAFFIEKQRKSAGELGVGHASIFMTIFPGWRVRSTG